MKRYLIISLVVMFVACSRKEDVKPVSRSDRKIVLQSLGDNVILGTFLELQTLMYSLEARSKSYFVEPTQAMQLLQLQNEWRTASLGWKRASFFTFSPLDEGKLTAVFFTQPDTAAIELAISQTNFEIDSTYIANASGNSKGLLATEYLIFGSNNAGTAAVINSFTSKNGKRRLAYLEALTKNLLHPANSMMYKWSKGGEGHVTSFIASDGNDDQSSVTIIANQLVRSIARIKNERIGVPMGYTSGIPRIDLIEGRFSNQSLALIRAELEGIQSAFTGRGLMQKSNGLNYLLDLRQEKSGGKLLSAEIEEQFSKIYMHIKSMDIPLKEAIVKKREDVQKLYDLLNKLEQTVRTDVVKNLNS